MTVRATSLRRDPKSGSWKARKAIPAAIRADYAKAYGAGHEAKFSAPSTASAQDARAQFAAWHAEIERRFQSLRNRAAGLGSDLSQRQAQALAGQWYCWFVGSREENPGTPQVWEAEAEKLRAAKEHLSAIGAAIRGVGLGRLGFGKAGAVANDNWMQDKAAVQLVLQHSPLLGVDKFLLEQNEQLSAAGYEVFFAALERRVQDALSRLQRLTQGDYSPDPVVAQFPTRTKAAGLTPSGLFDAYVLATKPARNTVIRWRDIFRQLDRFFPGRDAGSLTEEDAFKWRDDLRTRLSDKSVNEQYVAGAKVVFNWAVAERKLTANPFAALKNTRTKRAPKLRERNLQEHELRTILSATLETPPPRMRVHQASARRWAPWLCYYSGARAGEICQLRKEDVKLVRGKWVLWLTPEAGTIKDKEARMVPLHPHLIEQGFLDFVASRPKGPLFYDPTLLRKGDEDPLNPRRHPAEKVRMRLAEWIREVGVTSTDIQPTHAFRHTWKNTAIRIGIDKTVRDFIQGHAPETVGDTYSNLEGEAGIDILYAAIERFPRFEVGKSGSAVQAL